MVLCENCGKPATMYRDIGGGEEVPTCDSCTPGNWTGTARPVVVTMPDLGGRLTLSKQEAADALGVSVDYLEKRVMPDIRTVSRGGRVLIPRQELDDWVSAASTPARFGARAWQPDARLPPGVRTAVSSGAPPTPASVGIAGLTTAAGSKSMGHGVTLAPRRARAAQSSSASYRQARWSATSAVTLRGAWETFRAEAEQGVARNRNGHQFKASTLRGYERGWKKIDPELGAHRLTDIRRADIQAMIDRWIVKGWSPSTIRNSLDPLRVLYRRAIQRDVVVTNPTLNLEVPADAESDPMRFASRDEAKELLNALP